MKPAREEAGALTAHDIVTAAAAIIDEGGPHALTMRRVADAVGVAVTGIYWHVGNREELLAAVGEHMIARIGTLKAVGETPVERIASLAHQLRDNLLAHAHLVGVVHQQAKTGSMFQPVHAAMATELAALGHTGTNAALALRSLQVHVVGSVLLERSIERFGPRRDSRAFDAWLGDRSDRVLVEAMSREPDRDELFEYGLQSLLATLAASTEI